MLQSIVTVISSFNIITNLALLRVCDHDAASSLVASSHWVTVFACTGLVVVM